ncbi:MAG: hypothetical protein ACJ764_01760 [Solirubrobacteraceae bacterium]
MHFVLLAEHSAEVCPMSNSKTRDLMMEAGPQVPDIAERNSVKIVAGPYVNREHLTVAVVEADTADQVDRFILESRLAQWNSVRVLPSVTMQEGMQELQEHSPVF